MKAVAVIGANYGDEGKGLMVDYLAHKMQEDRPVVIRSNGGAQAAHSVQTPDGRRHVFHHFGSGSFVGAPTHFSKFMICNPMVFVREWKELRSLGITPTITTDPHAMLTIPFDMLINQAAESFRGNERHGSCGLGIGETVERHDNFKPITVEDIDDLTLSDLKKIRDQWVEGRLKKLGVDPIPEAFVEHFNNDGILEAWLQEARLFRSRVELVHDADLSRLSRSFIFEAAQGLALDQDNGDFPYVTRSNTGLKNIIAICRSMGCFQLDPIYMTRCYMTRHGAGPLPRERDISYDFKINDPTNVPNDWQGTLRFAPLDVRAVWKRVMHDQETYGDDIATGLEIAVTCVDQARNDTITVYDGRREERISISSGPRGVIDTIGSKLYPKKLSYGPTRDTIQETVFAEDKLYG